MRLLFLIFCFEVFAQSGCIFQGNDILCMKPNLKFQTSNNRISTGNTGNPTITATAGLPGDVYVNSVTGEHYIKLDTGTTTNWKIVTLGPATAVVNRNWYSANTIAGNSTNNTAIPYFTTVSANQMLPLECGTMVNTAADGIFLTVAHTSMVNVVLNAYNIGPAYTMGVSVNPTAAELDTDFANIPTDKQGCKIETLGTTSNAQSCTLSYMASIGDTIYIHANPGQTWANNGAFSVRFTCLADAAFGGGGGGGITGPPTTNFGAVALWGDLTGTSLIQTNYTFPTVDGAPNQILRTNGTGVVSWVNVPSSITTPNPTVVNRPALYGNTTGTTLVEAPYTMPVIPGVLGQILTTDGVGVATWEDPAPTIITPAVTVVNQLAQFDSIDGKTLKNTAWTVPNAIGSLNQYLTVVGGVDTAWTSLPGTIVYVGGAPVVANNLPMFGGTAGTQIVDSGVSAASVGNVKGPASSVTNTVASFADGTGKLLRNGAIDYLDMTNSVTNPAFVSGRLFWNDSAKALAYYPNVSGPIMDIGQKIWIQCRNNTGATLNTGQVVRVTGSIGNIPTVGLAQANTVILSSAIAAVAAPILNNTNGFCTTFGLIRNMNTSAFVEGDLVYLSPTVPGGITTVKPAINAVKMGRIINAHPTLGQFGVNPEAIPNTQAITTSPAALIAGGTVVLSGEGDQIIRITSAADITLATVAFSGIFADGSKISVINVGNFTITIPYDNTAAGSFLGFGTAALVPNAVLNVIIDGTSARVREQSRSF